MRRTTWRPTRRPRSVWFALGTGSILSLFIVAAVLLPLLGLVGASLVASPVVRIPIGHITVAIVAGYFLSLGILVWPGLRRHGFSAWFFAVAAVVCTLIISLYPAIAVATSAVHTGSEVFPFILKWFHEGAAALPR